MAEYAPLVLVAGDFSQQPIGDELKLRGNLNVDVYIVTASGDLVIEPGATSALRASSGGDARGQQAVDLQMERTADDQVASGLRSFVGGGQRNRASSSYTAVLSGLNNVSSAFASCIGGGGAHTVSGSYSFTGGGYNNDVSATSCVIAGGYRNDISYQAYRSFIGGGYENDMRGDYSAIGGGRSNYVDYQCVYAIIGGGYDNTISNSDHSFIGGGYLNQLSAANWGVIGGGDTNVVTVTGGCIGGGQDNTMAGIWGFIGGGEGNDVQNQYGAICGGLQNTVSGDYGSIPGGRLNTADATYSTAMGFYAQADLYGEFAQASGRFATSGDAQASNLVARNATLDATPVVLYLDGVSATLNMPADTTWAFDIFVVAHGDTNIESAGYQLQGVIRRAGTADPVIVGTRLKTVIAEDNAAWDADVQVDTVNDDLEIYVTGSAGKTISWAAHIELTVVKG